jgi:hypothetical protein
MKYIKDIGFDYTKFDSMKQEGEHLLEQLFVITDTDNAPKNQLPPSAQPRLVLSNQASLAKKNNFELEK